MNILGIIPARKGSKTVKRKNIKIFSGIPLIEHTFIEVKNIDNLTKTIVTTDDNAVIDLAQKHNLPFIQRSEKLSNDTASMIDVVKDVLAKEENEYDAVVVLQPTSPFRKRKHICQAINKFKQNKFDTLVSVYEAPHQFSVSSLLIKDKEYVKPLFNNVKKSYNKQDKIRTYARNGAIYIAKTSFLQEQGALVSDQCGYYIMNERDSIDIDTEYDFLLANFLVNFQN